MDSDIIFPLLIFGASVIISLISGHKKKEMEKEDQKNHAQAALPDHFYISKKKRVIKPARPIPAARRPIPTRKVEIAPIPVVEQLVAPASIAINSEEGQRVTTSNPMEPVAASKKPSALKDAKASLRDRDALRRAIILGEILEPKF